MVLIAGIFGGAAVLRDQISLAYWGKPKPINVDRFTKLLWLRDETLKAEFEAKQSESQLQHVRGAAALLRCSNPRLCLGADGVGFYAALCTILSPLCRAWRARLHRMRCTLPLRLCNSCWIPVLLSQRLFSRSSQARNHHNR